MQPAPTHVTVDGVSMPVEQALGGVREMAAAGDELYSHLTQPMAQYVGPALAASNDGCTALKRRLKTYLRALNKAAGGTVDNLAQPLIDYVSKALVDGDTARQMLSTAVAGVTTGTGSTGAEGSTALPPITPIVSPGPPFTGPVTAGGGAGTRGAAAGSSNWVIYVDCPGLIGVCADPSHALIGSVRALGPDVGPSMPCPAGPSCGTATWIRYPYLSWPTNPGIAGLSAFDGAEISSGRACAWAQATCGVAPPPTPVAQWNIYYYCDPCADPNGLHNWHAQTAPSPPGNPWLLFSGAGVNFKDQPTAQAALDSSGAKLDSLCQYKVAGSALAQCGPPQPPPPPPPPPPTCPPCQPPAPPEPQADCDTAAKCEIGYPEDITPVGDPCKDWPALIKQLSLIGGGVLKTLGDTKNSGGAIDLPAVRFQLACLGDNYSIPEEVWNKLCKCYNKEKTCSLLDSWGSAIRMFVPGDFTLSDLYSLLALRSLLECVGGTAVSADTSATSSGETSASLGLAGTFGL